jgi:hypothetical protein
MNALYAQTKSKMFGVIHERFYINRQIYRMRLEEEIDKKQQSYPQGDKISMASSLRSHVTRVDGWGRLALVSTWPMMV